MKGPCHNTKERLATNDNLKFLGEQKQKDMTQRRNKQQEEDIDQYLRLRSTFLTHFRSVCLVVLNQIISQFLLVWQMIELEILMVLLLRQLVPPITA